MKLALGLNSSDTPEDIATFVREGADEFFAGFIPHQWYNRYGWEVSLNRREFGPQNQFTHYRELEKVISTVHEHKKEVFITFNAHQYVEEQTDIIRQIIFELEKLNPDGYIVADLSLMIMLREWGINRPLHLSTGAACFNKETIRYFVKRVGIKRAVIPRKMSLEEMEELIETTKDLKIEFEVFILHSRCFFNDEYCFSWHSGISPNFCNYFGLGSKSVSNRFPSSWKQEVENIFKDSEGQFMEGSILDELLKKIFSYPKERGCSLVNTEGINVHTKGKHPLLPFVIFNVCGLCAIEYLKKIGVAVLKIPARGAAGGPSTKKKFLQIVNQVVKHPQPTPEFCQQLIDSPGFCSGLGRCYYYVEKGK